MPTASTTSAQTGSTVLELAQSLASGRVQMIDLTTPLSTETPTLELPEPFVNLIDFSLDVQSEYNDPGPFWKHANIHTGEHIGTHIDAPIHWISGKDGKDVSEIEPARLIGPAVVVDFSEFCTDNHDFLIDVAHIQQWEAENGAFPENSWILFRTGWSSRTMNRTAFLNNDADGNSHCPGFTAACAEYLAHRAEISGIGVETVGIDAGQAGLLDPPFPMHYYLMGNDKYGITSLRNLDQLPTTGAVIVVAPLPIVGGTGSPSRVFALVEQPSV